MSKSSSLNKVFSDLPVTIFEAMSQAARDNAAINLGQGFPDDPGPEDIRRAAAEASLNGYNQYPSMMGLPELRQAIAGALMALIEPGDEVLLFQPFYDAYLPLVQRAGGVPRFVRLGPPHFRFDEEMLAKAFTLKTRVVLFNNPLNPAATVFPREDLELLARYCEKFNAVAICDEVWEHVMFDGRRHVPLIAIPGMRERCVKIGSAGKIFSLTGWKVGFVCAAPNVLRVLAKAHQFITFTTPPNLQAAVTYGLGKTDDYFEGMRADLQRSRDRFTSGLRSLGFPVIDAAATYFVNVDLASLGLNEDDETFCKRLVLEHKVAAIPVSAFYADNPVRSVVRFCFAKRDATLDAALERLAGALKRAS